MTAESRQSKQKLIRANQNISRKKEEEKSSTEIPTSQSNSNNPPPPTKCQHIIHHPQQQIRLTTPSLLSPHEEPSRFHLDPVLIPFLLPHAIAMAPPAFLFAATLLVLLLAFPPPCSSELPSTHRPLPTRSLCAELVRPMGYPCVEHKVQTEDGYVLAVQQIPHGRETIKKEQSPPIFLQHGLFQAGDTWFVNPIDESLGYILADRGFDVWIGNVRGTHWSYGHTTYTEKEKAFWDWSWEDLVQYDLLSMLKYVHFTTKSKVFFVGHSQGTIMGFAALTTPDVAELIEAAAFLCPISYLNHISSRFILRAVKMKLDKMLLNLGIHELNFRSHMGVEIMDTLCDVGLDCTNLLASITGENCCFNSSRIDYYLQYEPHPSSTKNLNHLFQMIRKGTFTKYDYGIFENLKRYGSFYPPAYDLANIPKSIPLWMAYGGQDALADVIDVKRTVLELPVEPKLLYLDSYGHIDFVMSVTANDEVYPELIGFFRSQGQSSSM